MAENEPMIENFDQELVTTAAEERISVASQGQLMWWRFRKHKLAMAATVVVIIFYVVAVFVEFFAYSDPRNMQAIRSLIPPQRIYFFDQGKLAPYVHPIVGQRDMKTLKLVYVPDKDTKLRLRFFARGFEYKLLGLIPMDIHLIGMADPDVRAEDSLFLLGTDQLGRDVFGRIIYASQISLSIGLVGVLLSLLLGVLLGGLSGFYGGAVDTIIQRVIEILLSIPTIPLWLGLGAAMPKDWDIMKVYFAITIILSLIGWTQLGRVVRGRFLALREEDFVMAAELVGCSRLRVILRHMTPAFFSHIIATTTLALPQMILNETALSFLGLGLRPPAISWGVMLQDAQQVQVIVTTPWLLVPAIPVIVVILAFNFMGDGLRDAADPYGQ
jgi:peptide/nickel transport system permease protein